MTVDLEQVLGLAAQVAFLVGMIAAFTVWLRRWIRAQVVRPLDRAAEQLQPNGGNNQETTRHLIEGTYEGIEAMQAQLNGLAETAAENRKIAMTALALAQDVGARLDRHLVDGHG